MNVFEPNVSALISFSIIWGVVSTGFYVMAGALPMDTRPDLQGSRAGFALVAANLLLLVIVAIGALVFGASSLRWTSLILLVGLGALFAPGLYNVWPSRWRDGLVGLAIVFLFLIAGLATLALAWTRSSI